MAEKTETVETGEIFKESFECDTFTWKITNVSSLEVTSDNVFQSPIFSYKDGTWILKMYPVGQTLADKDICFSIERLSSEIPKHEFYYKFVIKNENKQDKIVHSSYLLFDQNETKHYFRILWKKWYDWLYKETGYRYNDSVTLVYEFLSKKNIGTDLGFEAKSTETFSVKDLRNESLKPTGELLKESFDVTGVTWKISKIHSIPLEVDIGVQSPSFSFDDAIWILEMFPYGQTKFGSENYIDVGIKRLQSEIPKQSIFYKNSFQTFNKNYEERIKSAPLEFFSTLINSYDRKWFIFDPNHVHDYITKIVTHSELLSLSDTECDAILLVCLFQITKSTQEELDREKKKARLDKEIERFRKNFKDLFLSGRNSDLILNVKGKEFRVHQSILRARLETFDVMLSHEMLEQNRALVDIQDCEPAAFEQFLYYIYNGEVESLDENNMLDLYYIADKYMIDLKEECCEFIKKSITINNISHVIQLALKHDDTGLLECATKYFVDNVDDILSTVEWQIFAKQCPTEANELMIKSVKKLKNPNM